MIRIGQFNTLKINRIEAETAWLEDEGQELEIPREELPHGAQQGDFLKAFVYNKGKGLLAATTIEPDVQVNQFAFLTVTGQIEVGAFLHWGLPKDLFLPKGCMKEPVEEGDQVLIRVVLNSDKSGLIADGDWERYIEKGALEEGQEVSLIALDTGDLGTRVIVDHRYMGLVYKSEGYRVPEVGSVKTGYVLQSRGDGKLDISFKRKGWNSVLDSREVLLETLKKNGGTLPLHDKSDPKEIRERLNMSKKVFKKAAGNLYKDGLIRILDKGIELV